MKGLILAAGRGSRLLPISATRPKHTLPVAGVPIIVRAVQALQQAGITDIGIVTSPASETELREVTFPCGPLTFIRQEEALGTGHAVLCAQDFLAGQPTLLYLGDNLFQDSLRGVVEALDGADAVIGVKRVPNPQAYGVAVVQGGLLRHLIEKPREPQSDLAACGVFAFQPGLLAPLAELVPSERGEIEFPQLLSQVVEQGGVVRAVEFQGFWSDAGRPADLLLANAHFLEGLAPRLTGRLLSSTTAGKVVVEAGASVQDSELIGPVWIGPHASVRGSRVGPHVSIGAHARVQAATVQGSLVDDFARILGPQRAVQQAVIGRHATVTGLDGPGPQLVIGDRSVVRL